MMTLGAPQGGHDWQLIVVYRGLHCPLCKRYLTTLEGMKDTWAGLDVDIAVVSGDPEAKAQEMSAETGLSLAMGYDLSVEQMHSLGLYVSDPRSPQETDRPFAEPGVFIVNEEGNLQIIDISNAPFARPDLESLSNGIKFVRANAYPVRGTLSST